MNNRERQDGTALMGLSDDCAGRLRAFVEESEHEACQTAALAATLKVCSGLANKQEAAGVAAVAGDVATYLQQRDQQNPLQEVEAEQLALAAGWLEHLSRLHAAGLPWPQQQIADFKYTFDLLLKTVRLGAAVEAGVERPQLGSDLFSHDPELSSADPAPTSSSAGTDPFAVDPGLDPATESVDDLLRYLTTVNQHSRSCPVDPFADDNEPTTELSGRIPDVDTAAGLSVSEDDLFAADPSPDG